MHLHLDLLFAHDITGEDWWPVPRNALEDHNAQLAYIAEKLNFDREQIVSLETRIEQDYVPLISSEKIMPINRTCKVIITTHEGDCYEYEADGWETVVNENGETITTFNFTGKYSKFELPF